jgi:hypothetical protein
MCTRAIEIIVFLTASVLSYRGITIKGMLGFPGCPFSIGTDKLLISQTISFSDGAKRKFDRRTDNTTSIHPYVC